MYTCKQVTRLVLEKHERRLSWRERVGIRLHLLICESCTRFERQMRFLRTAARRYARHHLDAAARTVLTPGARDRIRRKLGAARKR